MLFPLPQGRVPTLFHGVRKAPKNLKRDFHIYMWKCSDLLWINTGVVSDKRVYWAIILKPFSAFGRYQIIAYLKAILLT